MPLTVELDACEVMHAATVGVMRRSLSLLRSGRPRKEQESVDRWTAEVEGACAELAVAKQTGTYWNALVATPRKTPDCGPYHVRYTPLVDGHLIVELDDPDGPYVLVIGRAPRFLIVGMIRAAEAREVGSYRPGRNGLPSAHWVAQVSLVELPPF